MSRPKEQPDTAREIAKRLGQSRKPDPPPAAADPPKPRLVARKVSEIMPESIGWLWPGRFPFGMPSEIMGDPGMGKGTIAADIIARATTGRPYPGTDGPARQPVNALMLAGEDPAAQVIRPRLEAAGADLDRVRVVDHVECDEAEYDFTLNAGMDLLRGLVDELQAKLIVIDPLDSFIGERTDTNVNSEVRNQIMRPLARLAEETGAAVLLIRHLNKSSGTNAIYRGGGSIGFSGAARASFSVTPHPDDSTLRSLAGVKFNIGPFPRAFAYRVEGATVPGSAPGETISTSCIWWGSEFDATANDLLAAKPPQRRDGRTADAESFLRDFLSGGPRPAAECYAAGEAADIKERTMDRAKKALGVVSRKSSFGGAVRWQLPEPPPPVEEADDPDGINPPGCGDQWEGDGQ